MKKSPRNRFVLLILIVGVLIFFFQGAPDEAQPQPEKPVVKMKVDREKVSKKSLDSNQILQTILVKTNGNWAYNRKANQTSVELLDSQNLSVSRSYLPAFAPAQRGEKVSLTGVETNVSALRVHFFAGQTLTDIDFDLPENLLAQPQPEVTLLISPYRLSPRAAWTDTSGVKHYFWPRGREDWPNGNKSLTTYISPQKKAAVTPVAPAAPKVTTKRVAKKKIYVSKNSVVRRSKRGQYHTSYKWGNWSQRFNK